MSQVLGAMRTKAEIARSNAGHGGEHHDGGASAIEIACRMYEMGAAGECPREWRDLYEQIERRQNAERDPEFATYTRLREKFEGR